MRTQKSRKTSKKFWVSNLRSSHTIMRFWRFWRSRVCCTKIISRPCILWNEVKSMRNKCRSIKKSRRSNRSFKLWKWSRSHYKMSLRISPTQFNVNCRTKLTICHRLSLKRFTMISIFWPKKSVSRWKNFTGGKNLSKLWISRILIRLSRSCRVSVNEKIVQHWIP